MTNNDDINAAIKRLEGMFEEDEPADGFTLCEEAEPQFREDITLVCREARLAQRYREALEAISYPEYTEPKDAFGFKCKADSFMVIAEEALKSDGD